MRNFIVCASLVLWGMSSALPCMAANSEKSENVVNVENQRGGYTFLGYLYAESVVMQGSTQIVTVSAPKETVTGTAPSCEWSINSAGKLVIIVPERVGVEGLMEVGVRLAGGGIGVYYVTW